MDLIKPKTKRVRLTPRLLLTVVLTASVLTLLLTTFQLYSDWQHGRERLNERLERIGQSFVPAIQNSAWILDEQQLQKGLETILQLGAIQHVNFLHRETGHTYSFGEPVDDKALTKSFPVSHTHRGRQYTLGILKVSASTHHHTQQMWSRAGILLLGNAVKILLIALVLLYFFHHLVTRRIMTIANQAMAISAGESETAIQLPGTSRYRDELSDVVEAINTMLQQQRGYHNSLHKEVERQLQASEERFKKTFDDNPDPCWLIDNHTFIECNQAAIDILGYPDGNALKAVHPSAVSPKYQADGRLSREKADEMMNLALQRGIHRFEWLHQKASGETFPVEVTLSAFNSEGHQMIFCIWRDISERKQIDAEREQLQKQLLHTQKMEAIGQLTGGIAHDFNNILASVLGYTELMQSQGNMDGPNSRYLNEIHHGAIRGKNLVSKMLAFARGSEEKAAFTDPVSVVKEAVQMLSSTLPSSIHIKLEIGMDPMPIAIAADALYQIITNLIINARDAMHGKGNISISLNGPVHADGYCYICGETMEGEHIVLTVTDDGDGIPAELLSRIFDPFFTTKEVGKGSGMGLSMVAGIVRNTDGHIQVESQPGKGTSFRLLFPPTSAAASSINEGKAPHAMADGHGEHILIVDDEPALTDYMSELLGSHGYRCSTENNSRQALSRMEANPQGFDLLLTDQTMPGLSGTELIALLREIRPTMPVILTSGYSDTINQERAKQLQIPYLEKPVAAERILQTVAELLSTTTDNTS